MPPNPNDALHQVFADEDYGFRMRFEQAAAAEFFGDTPEHAEIIKDREKCLTSAPELCVSAIHGLAPLLDEAIEFAASVANVPEPEPRGSDEHALLSLGRAWEPDFLLLKKSDDESIRLLGGAYVFHLPGAWLRKSASRSM